MVEENGMTDGFKYIGVGLVHHAVIPLFADGRMNEWLKVLLKGELNHLGLSLHEGATGRQDIGRLCCKIRLMLNFQFAFSFLQMDSVSLSELQSPVLPSSRLCNGKEMICQCRTYWRQVLGQTSGDAVFLLDRHAQHLAFSLI